MPKFREIPAHFLARKAEFHRYTRKAGRRLLWTGPRKSDGLGVFETFTVQRIAWFFACGQSPTTPILWTCGNKLCVEASHLFAGKRTDGLKGDYRSNTKLTRAQADKIRERYVQDRVLQSELAKEYGVSVVTISKVINNVLWRKRWQEFRQ